MDGQKLNNSVNEYKMFVKQLLYDEKKCVFDNNKLLKLPIPQMGFAP